jgi:hypothetical protein
MRPGSELLVAIALCLGLAACASDAPAVSEPSAAVTGPSPSASASGPVAEPSPMPEPSPEPSPEPKPKGPEAEALLALCAVEADLARGDIERAEATFEDDAHETLHEIAHEVEEVDREVAARLLVAKAKVEAGFADPAVRAPAQRRAVAALIDAMREAMATLDLDQPACPA